MLDCKGIKGYESEDGAVPNEQEKCGAARISERDGAVRKGLYREGAARNCLYQMTLRRSWGRLEQRTSQLC